MDAGHLSQVEASRSSQPLASGLLASGAETETLTVSGTEAILKLQPFLLSLSVRYGQQGTMDHLDYFLRLEGAEKKTPHLVLVGKGMGVSGVSRETVLAAVLLHEYRVLGCGTGIFATDDTSGRRTMVAPADRRMTVARLAAAAVLRAGGRLVVASFLDAGVEDPKTLQEPGSLDAGWRWATRRRLIRSHLALGATLDATLATMGQHTRRNLRYYRRRAEAELGCRFVAEATIGREELLALNRECTYPVTDDRAGWRYDAVAKVPGMALRGLQDREGRWLSLLCARSYYDAVEIDWQMNRDGMASSSLSTVLRSFFLEFEIGRGTKKMFMEGGTPHPMRHSFAMHVVRDLAVSRSGWLAPLVRVGARVGRRLSPRLVPQTNFVLQLLLEESLGWRSGLAG